MSEDDVAYSLMPDNVRSKEFDDFESEQAYNSLFSDRDLKDYDVALLGVPEPELFLERFEQIFGNSDLGNLFLKESYLEPISDSGLNTDESRIHTYPYQGEPSRVADVKALEELKGDKPLLLVTWSYNVPRTNFETARNTDMEGLKDGYPLKFDDFEGMNVSESTPAEWIKGAVYTAGDSIPELSGLTENIANRMPETADFSGEEFEYEPENISDHDYITVGVPWSDDPAEIDKRHSMESFKSNTVPGWQLIKNGLKKGGERISDEFNY